MNTKTDKFSEMEKVLTVKDATNVELMSLLGRFGLGNLLRHLSLEKLDGINAATLILALCLFRLNGKSIFSALPVDFSLHRGKGKNGNYGLSGKQQKKQYSTSFG